MVYMHTLVANVADMLPTCRATPTCCPFFERHADVGDTNVCDVGAKIGKLRGYSRLLRAYKVNLEVITRHVGNML